MKSAGIVRPIDEAGRLVLPKELRKAFNIIDSESSVEIFTDGDKIILRKYAPACIFCDSLVDDMVEFKGHKVCKSCIEKLNIISE
ncbi:MAG: AbrB/MazE/SpoVT family DNA-binding domain-containing protein [Acutalibacteraceae bacterium]|nr:AbrB/MazE/SpoVT family DNA-binding domain-containing protein [Clostridiales bacterium]